MLRLIHTADWHIGQYFYGYSRYQEHRFFFDWLKNIICEQQVDVLLIAGDIFDNPNPSAIFQQLYYTFLREVTSENPGLQIVITAGNHDSAARLEAPNPLLEQMNVHVRGTVARNADGMLNCRDLLVPLVKDGSIQAWCIAAPYLRQGDYPNSDNYANGIKEMYGLLYEEVCKIKENSHPVVCMGHLQATGSEVSGNDRSERTVIGGLECVSPEAFDRKDIVYTALGHLHKAQRVSGREHIRYAGSPLPMSFAEKHYKQGVNLIVLDDNKPPFIERILFEPLVKLVSLPAEPKPLAEVLQDIAALPDGKTDYKSPFLELKVLLTEPEPTMRNQVEQALKAKAVRLASAVPYKIKKEGTSKTLVSYEELKAIDPLTMARQVFQDKYAVAMPERMAVLMENIIEEVSR